MVAAHPRRAADRRCRSRANADKEASMDQDVVTDGDKTVLKVESAVPAPADYERQALELQGRLRAAIRGAAPPDDPSPWEEGG
jgi:hypothetical protein